MKVSFKNNPQWLTMYRLNLRGDNCIYIKKNFEVDQMHDDIQAF